MAGARRSWAVGIALLSLGKAARALGEFPRGAATYREAVALFAEHGDRGKVASCLEGLAHLAALDGEPERAARLFGAAEALYETAGLAPSSRSTTANRPWNPLAAVHAALDDGGGRRRRGRQGPRARRSTRPSSRRGTWRTG